MRIQRIGGYNLKTHEFKIENQELVGQRIDKLLPNNEF